MNIYIYNKLLEPTFFFIIIHIFINMEQQQQHQFLQLDSNIEEVGFYGNEHRKSQWGWSWLERWMASQPYHNRQNGDGPRDDIMSDKNVEMDLLTPSGPENVTMGRLSADTTESFQRQAQMQRHPGYMAPTQSAKAKVRTQGLSKHRGASVAQWNPSTKMGAGTDSSSSGGGTLSYQAPRTPSPQNNGVHGPTRWIVGRSPDSNASHDRGRGWRFNFG